MHGALSTDGGGAANDGGGVAARFSALHSLSRVSTNDAAWLGKAVARLAPRAASGGASRLTPAGAPLEAAVVWPTPGLRVSLDPDPDGSPADRARSCRAALSRPLAAAQAAVAARVGDWQRDFGGRYGAWLGLRVAGGELRDKLYLDVPEGCAWQSLDEEMAGQPAVLPRRQIRLTMIGLDPASGGTEFYYRCGRLFPAELDTLMRRFGLDERGGEVVGFLTTLTQRTVRFELPSYDMGFSCAFDAQGRARVFTWYSNATALLGPPERARAALLRVGNEAGWPMDAYDALTLPDDTGRVPEHGLVGVMLADGQPLHATATVALAPPLVGENGAGMTAREVRHG
ncbi:hypothetical protein [Stappia sp. ES.058]|uniref:hypothetical protein n=1 Tax=Stappia sp. ES.058 TaxID=1881061 RepID=UPI00087BFAF9|nr:hypothetical protein [Stappia sp. ES.058]SDU30632.1 hypothetical protein SAMN05428979_2870 [Stappia sp. ES.058]